MDKETIGKTIRRFRNRLGFTQNQLATKLRIQQDRISLWERGVYAPSGNTLIEIMVILEIEVNDFYKERD